MALTIEENEDYLFLGMDDAFITEEQVEQVLELAVAKHHVVIDFGNAESISGISALKKAYKAHRKSQKSFIVIVRESLLDDFEDDFPVVPTHQEALDYLEMEEIERQLGLE
ncbi:MAG: hypothetical protein LAT76_10430 [Schleiferiaceae bacterium]|nr:hypothetical protein [Schleiferiaceae bacterium]